MFLLGDTADIVQHALFVVLVQFIDNAIYYVLNMGFDLFFVVARMDIFGATPIGQQIYDNISHRIYMIFAIVMVFVFAYNMLLYIMQPDGRFVSDKMKPTTILKRITFSMILIVLSPLIFKYMGMFQNHVLVEDTIPAIILGRSYGNKVMSSGHKISMITYYTFYHPQGMALDDFIADPDATECDEYFKKPDDLEGIGKNFVSGLVDSCKEPVFSVKRYAGTYKKVFKNENLDKLMGVSSIAGIVFIIFAIGYIYSAAGRIFRLFALQIFAPVPIMMRIFDKDKNFDPWFKDIKSTYMDIFVRVGVISFVLYMCSLMPDILKAVSDAAIQTIINS